MSIVSYTGLPGSGKSYGVVENAILPALKKGRAVWTNIPLHQELLLRDIPQANLTQFTNDEIKESGFFDRLPGGVVFVVDECWRLWPAGLKANNADDEHKSFLAEHRHRVGEDGYSIEIILVTQDLSQLALWVRSLVETTYRSVKMTALGSEKSYRIDIYTGPVTGQNPPEKSRMRQTFGKYKKDVYQYYQSHTQGTGQAGIEQKADGRANLLKSGMFTVALPLALIAVVYGVYSTVQHFSSFGQPEQETVIEVPVTTDKPQQTTPSAVVEKRRVVSSDWRVTGRINQYIILSSGSGHYRRVHWRSGLCKPADLGEIQCEVNGELITEHSGRLPSHGGIVQQIAGTGDNT